MEHTATKRTCSELHTMKTRATATDTATPQHTPDWDQVLNKCQTLTNAEPKMMMMI